MKKELQKILNQESRQQMLNDYNELINQLGKNGASQKVVNEIIAY